MSSLSKLIRVDSHQHFWELERGDYHWLNSEPQILKRDFLPAELELVIGQSNIDYTITVQAAETVEETEYILQLAEQNNFIAGVVGWVDMNLSSSIGVLERFAGHSKFLGIRPVIQGIADPNWILNAELDPVFKWLIDNDLTFDALIKPAQLDALHILLLRYPELRVVIDHCAKPEIALNRVSPWLEKMQKISEDSTAFCKLSGLLTEAGEYCTYENLYPYMSQIVESFGAKRVMWGSDWPVCTLAASYVEWINYTEIFLNGFSLEDQASIWGGSAAEFYKLKFN